LFIKEAGTTHVAVDNTGNVGIGVTPAMASASYNGLHIGATYPTMKLSSSSSGHAAADGFHLRIDSTPRVEYWNYENTDQVFANNNGEKLRLLAGGGITFNGDTAAANALDDYEEGTYAAVVTGHTSGTFTMATENTLAYTKIGRLVTVQGYVGIQSGSVSGKLRLSLPFAPTALTEDADYNFPSLMVQNTGNTNSGQKYLFLQTDGSAYFYKVADDGSAGYMFNTDVDSNFEIGVSFTYISG
jgi:hypothetical protein